MTNYYLVILLLTATWPVAGRVTTPLAPADTVRTVVISAPSDTTAAAFGLPPFPTIQPALSRVAGVQYTPFSGAPGAWATVRIRGISSLTGSSQPLYVVDGVPVYNTDITPEQWGSAEDFSQSNSNYNRFSPPHTPTANPLLDVPVEDVEQVEVLKGADATARYGLQGTNGVVLISTRRGGDGQAGPQPLRVRYAGWGGVQQVRQRYELLGAQPYAGLANAAAVAHGQPAPYSPADLQNLGEGDWQDRVLRAAAIQSHHLSLDGNARRTRYYVAADYLHQTGVVEESSLSRYHLRVNLDQQLTSKLSVGLKASASQTDQHYAGTLPDANYLIQNTLLAEPAVRPGTANPAAYNDPLAQLHYYASAPRTRRVLAQLSATYRFSDALSLSVRGSREQTADRALGYSPSDYLQPATTVGETSTSSTSVHNWVYDAALRYQRTLGDRHALTASLTYLRQQFEQELEKDEYIRSGPNTFRKNYQYWTESRGIHSPAASFGYTYAGRYEVQASLRVDLVLKDDHTVGEHEWSPGAQLSWHVNKEAFLAAAPGLSDLTLWAGAGRSGTYFSPDRTTHYDAGLRLGVLGGRLTLEAGAYQRRTRHALAVLPYTTISSGGGLSTYYQRPEATLLNRGLELTLGSTWRLGALAGTTQLAAATNRNELEEISPGPINGLNFFNGSSLQTLEKGQPVGRYFVFEQDGTYPVGSPKAGQVRFRDRNNDGQINDLDGFNQGSSLPRYTLNFGQQLRLRRFQLAAQLDGLFGYQILNTTLVKLDTPTGITNSSPRALDYWTPAHQDTSVPQPGGYPSYLTSDRALESGNHARLTQLTLSYDVLTTGPRRASVWAGGQNLFVTGHYRGFDPNVSSGGSAPLQAGQDASAYPVARVWQVGVRGQF